MGHSKSTFAQNFQFLTPFLPLFLFILHVPPPQPTFALVSYPSQKTFRDAYEFSNEKSGSGKRK